jgi:hypothetical protein
MLKRRSCHQHQALQFLFLQGAYLKVQVDLGRHNGRSRGAKPEAGGALFVGTGKSCFACLYHITNTFTSSTFNSSHGFSSALTSFTFRS